MKYPFICECGNKEEVSMPITQYTPDGHMCSVCGRTIRYGGVSGRLTVRYPYCHCGARMDEVEE